MKPRYILVLLAALFSGYQAYGQGNGAVRQTADVVGQGDAGPVVSADGARLIRHKNGLTASVSMPTPLPGSYDYPPETFPGHPEAYTGWAFVFNNPAGCDGPCDGNDLGPDKPARGGVYNFAGHVSGGGNLQLVGHVSVGDTPFRGALDAPLDNPLGAEVHLAVAPHGMLDPSIMPTQIKSPVGSPPFWWLAFFFAGP